MASPGRRSLAAFSVSRCWVLLPARFVAGAVVGCVWSASSVSPSSPVVAAVRVALARSLRLAALAVRHVHYLRKAQRRQPNEVSLSSAGGEERRTTNTSNAGRPTNVPRPLRSGACTMQEARQPPLNPAAGTPAATIGMRPATPLRTKTKSVNTTPSGCRASRVLLRVQCCPRPSHSVDALSKKKV